MILSNSKQKSKRCRFHPNNPRLAKILISQLSQTSPLHYKRENKKRRSNDGEKKPKNPYTRIVDPL